VPFQREAGCTVSGNHPLAAIHEEAVMKKAAIVMMVAFIAVMVLAPAAMAQEGATSGGGKALGALAVAIGMGAAAFGCGLGQGRIASAACEGMARNPGAAGPIRAAMILGLVFVETLVLFTLAMLALKA
jgi:F-type H+-transporting ATPase subunit c